jgi:ABC-type nitrate/sulfonate/bicarbonate transport system substrate-binding protein
MSSASRLELPLFGVSREFLRAQRGVVKRFLRGYIEGIKIFNHDRALSIEILGRYINANG